MDQMVLKTYSGAKDDDIILDLTDLALHITKMREAKSLGDKVQQAIELQEPDRIYRSLTTKDEMPIDQIDLLSFLQGDPSFVEMVKRYQKAGRKIMIRVPKEGLPILSSRDFEEFANGTKGQRIIRKLTKKI